MDLKVYREKMAKAGPHPGLSQWHTDTILLYRCRDINEKEFRRRFVVLSDKFENLLEQSLPENMDTETYELASGYYNAIANCLDSYLEGIDEVLHWAETGDEKALEASRRCFKRGDKEWNQSLEQSLVTEIQFQEMDDALLRSLGADPTAGY